MDSKIEVKEEDALSDDVASRSESQIFTKTFTMKTNSIPILLDDGCDVVVKTEMKSEFCSQCDKKCAEHVLKQIKSETATCSSRCEIYIKTEIEEQTVVSDFGSQNKREFLPEDPVVKFKKYNSDNELDNKVEIKVEPWWLEAETSSGCNEIEDGDLCPVKSSRSCTEAISDEILGRDINSCNGKYHPKCKGQESDTTVIPSVEECVLSEEADEFSVGKLYSTSLNSKQDSLVHKGKRPDKQNISKNSFMSMPDFKIYTHQGKKLHQCKSCGKCFTDLSNLNRHKLIHEGRRPHQCQCCDKRFTHLQTLKRHNLIHEIRKLHQCNSCDKSFTELSNLKRHYLIHEGRKPHQCKSCDKRFTQFSDLKRHILIHEGKKPHQCNICDKSFTELSNLKRHSLIHEGKKPHQCKSCDKRFTQYSDLKKHNLIHEGKKPYQCKICDKSFSQVSHLNTHKMTHEGRRPHQCKTCGKNFSRLSHLRRHNMIHTDKKPHQCKACDKTFIQLSNLKRHNLIHESKKLQ